MAAARIRGEGPRLFQIYSAGNFVEASDRTPFLQIGETKYGKPILDRALSADTELDQAAKLTLLSFDATMRSNLSVGPPIDMLRYEKDSFSIDNFVTFEDSNPYFERAASADYMRAACSRWSAASPAAAGPGRQTENTVPPNERRRPYTRAPKTRILGFNRKPGGSIMRDGITADRRA